MSPRRPLLLALALTASVPACTPTYPRMIATRRYADAMCLATSQEEAEALVRAVERDAAPRINLYPVHDQEIAPLLTDAGREASKKLLLLRARTAHDALSIGSLTVDVSLRRDPATDKAARVGSLSPWNPEAIGLFALTGETPPSSHTVIDGQAVAAAVFTLGLSRLFSSKPISEEVEPSDADYEARGPKASAILRALSGSGGGFVVSPEDASRDIRVEATVSAGDYLSSKGACSLDLYYELDLPPLGPGAVPVLDRTFGTRMRLLRDLPMRARSYVLSNPTGRWSSP